MARTPGSISLVSISFSDLLSLLGEGYTGKITISKKWLDTVTQGTEDYVLVTRESLLNRSEGDDSGIDTERPPVAAQAQRRPSFEVED